MLIELESPVERAVFSVQLASADFILAIKEAKTVDDALRIRELIKPLVMLMEVCEGAALERAGELNP